MQSSPMYKRFATGIGSRHTQSPASSPSPEPPCQMPAAGAKLPLAPTSAPCKCNRPSGHLICQKCGHEWEGRLAVVCPRHPNRMQLMDFQQCVVADCRSHQVKQVNIQRQMKIAKSAQPLFNFSASDESYSSMEQG